MESIEALERYLRIRSAAEIICRNAPCQIGDCDNCIVWEVMDTAKAKAYGE